MQAISVRMGPARKAAVHRDSRHTEHAIERYFKYKISLLTIKMLIELQITRCKALRAYNMGSGAKLRSA